MLSFKPTFSLSFHFHQRLFNSSSLSAIRVVSSAYLSLLILLPTILIPAIVTVHGVAKSRTLLKQLSTHACRENIGLLITV